MNPNQPHEYRPTRWHLCAICSEHEEDHDTSPRPTTPPSIQQTTEEEAARLFASQEATR